jgi:hypothetical protein
MGKLFSGGDTPKPTPVAKMPDPEDPQVKEAARRKALAVTQRSGRASTVLSRSNSGNASSGAGTQAYGNSLLGQAG